MAPMRRSFTWLPVLLACLVGLEGCLQVVYRVRNGSWLTGRRPYEVEHVVRVDDKRGYAYVPNFRDEGQGLTMDEFGFRISPTQKAPATGADVIVALGDSVPFGHGLRDEETYPFALDALLRDAASPLAVVNAGVQSYNLQQSIERFYRDVLEHYHPVAITLQTANDVALLLTYRAGWTPDTTWAPYRSNVAGILGWSATLHYLVPVLMPVAGMLAAALPGSLFQVPEEAMLANEERLLHELIEVCRAKGTKLVLMPINPFYYQTTRRERNAQLSRWEAWRADTMGWERTIERYNDVLVRVAHTAGPAAGVYLFDVRAELDAQDREPLYIDFIHHSAEGNRRVAEGLFTFLEANRIVS